MMTQPSFIGKKCRELTKNITKLCFLHFRKTISEDVTSALNKEIQTWRKLYEDLHNKVKPFQVCCEVGVCYYLLT